MKIRPRFIRWALSVIYFELPVLTATPLFRVVEALVDPPNETMDYWTNFSSLGQNPPSVPAASDWERVSVSGTGNKEIYASRSLQVVYEIICD
jgi:hypothetical protein